MKYTKQYSTEVDYNNDTERVEPNVSLIVDKQKVKYNPYKVNGKAAKAGTIVLVKNSNTEKKIFVPYQSWDADTYSAYTPIGVVVVPFTHTLDGTVRIMSLKNMSLTDPENGSTATGGSYTDKSFYWGGYGSDISTLKNYNGIPTVDPSNQESGSMGFTDWARIPSNYVSGSTFSAGTASVLDLGTKYYSSIETGRYGISPYAKYDFRSYRAFYVYNSGTTNCMNDFDGYGNTQKILAVDNASSTAWQTASTIVNNSGSTAVHAPAQCCWRYTTIGIDEHKWYLPSCGELCYLPPRYADINEALTKLMLADSTKAVRLWRNDPVVMDSDDSVYGSWLWSSTEYSSNYARNVTIYGGYVNYYTKNNSNMYNRVRAFAALQL